ncbi:hypothetical protein GQ55_1G240900 [Panicum hallii var. hallii]|uniref:Uncharacterized protein n=1 Tax=Panicum hallii var. hallii TaxID=1504633 RepID=A0A2T7F6X6_9POAL|nr:hypothetical protein GQ55_1G240900 [Panicum hallii var. hallii]
MLKTWNNLSDLITQVLAKDNKFTLLARAGRQGVSFGLGWEVYLTTSLDQEGIKKVVQRVLGRVPSSSRCDLLPKCRIGVGCMVHAFARSIWMVFMPSLRTRRKIWWIMVDSIFIFHARIAKMRRDIFKRMC